ncbi:SHOCT domain-containing protein [Streptomyces sp. NPDC056169]|uniref:SHOCT domain-containing protein n=1 Tax=Streptomyces sp. NPDC056169 TaxID=3345734 RepID=UPI0035DE8655
MKDSMVTLAVDYPLLNMFWTMLMIFLWVLWFMLLFRIIGDIFRDDDLGGWGKAGWTVLVILLPFLGVFIYLIARGRGMGERELKRVRQNEEQFASYVRETAGTGGTGGTGGGHAEELARLAELKDRGAITEAEFAQAKAKVLAS